MGYYQELNRLEEMKKNYLTASDAVYIKLQEAYLVHEGYGHYDDETGRFIHTGPQEMNGRINNVI